MSAPLIVAAVQCTALFDDIAATSANVLARAREAADAGARLIVFPECYLQGHSYNSALVARRAMPFDDPMIVALAQALAPLPIIAIIGFFERCGDLVYNSAMVIEHGAVIGCYTKHDVREGGCTPGTERPIFQCGDWPFAISICRDTRSSELALDLAARGARLLVYPLGNMLPTDAARFNRELTATGHADRAREAGCWVVSADVVGTLDDWIAHGNTRIFTPEGQIVADMPPGETGMILATIR